MRLLLEMIFANLILVKKKNATVLKRKIHPQRELYELLWSEHIKYACIEKAKPVRLEVLMSLYLFRTVSTAMTKFSPCDLYFQQLCFKEERGGLDGLRRCNPPKVKDKFLCPLPLDDICFYQDLR